jgi:hypothetical protein
MGKEKTLKIFKFEDKNYIILSPSVSVIREARYRYSKAFTSAIKEGLYSRKKLEALLRHQNAEVLEDHFNRRADLLKSYAESRQYFEEEKSKNNPEQMEAFLGLMRSAKESLIQEDLSMNNLFANTAEQLAEEDRINFLTYSLIRYEENYTKIWESFDEFLEDPQFELVEHCKYQVMCWDFKLDPEISNKNLEKDLEDMISKVREGNLKKEEVLVPQKDVEKEEKVEVEEKELVVKKPRRKKKVAIV